MQQDRKGRSWRDPIIIAVAVLVAVFTLDWSSRMSWGAPDPPREIAEPEDVVRLDQVVVSAGTPPPGSWWGQGPVLKEAFSA